MKFWWISILLLTNSFAYAASCCGGGTSATGIMTADARWMFQTSYSDVTLLADGQQGKRVARPENQLESIRTTKFNYIHMLGTYWQFGVEVPVVEKIRSVGDEWMAHSGPGDLKVTTAYEFMPEFSRSWRPRGFVYTGLSLPTSPSIYTSKRPGLLDSRGTGHYHLLLGTLFQKRYDPVTLTLQPQLAYRFGRKFSDDNLMNEAIETNDSLDHMISLTATTLIIQDLDVFAGVTRNYLEAKAINSLSGEGQSALVHDVTLGLSYTFTAESSLSLSYTDQLLIEDTYNNTLGRSIGISYILKQNL